MPPYNRSNLLLRILGCFLLSVWTCHATAEPPKDSSDGLRVAYQSYYTAEIEAVIAAAIEADRIQGYNHAQAADNGFNKWLKGGENAMKSKQRAALERRFQVSVR